MIRRDAFDSSSHSLPEAARAQLKKDLQLYAETLVHQCGAAVVNIWICENGLLDNFVSAGLDPVPLGQATLAFIGQIRQPYVALVISEDSQFHDQAWADQNGIVAWAVCPLLIEDQLEGIIAMFMQKTLSDTTLDTLTVVSRGLAQTIQRHRPNAQANLAPARVEATNANGPDSDVAIILLTIDGVITDWNPGAEKLFGHRRADALGERLILVVPPDRLDEHRDILARVGRGEEVVRPDTVRRHKNGTLLDVHLTTSPLRTRDGSIVGAVTVARNLAEAKQREQHFHQAQKMEAFGKLASGVAHDFNNLLTVISGYSEILMTRIDFQDPMREWAAEIHKAGQRAETLTRQLLTFSRKQVIEPRVLDLHAVVCDTEKMLRRLIGEDILMTTMFAPNLPPVKIDPGQIQQVILNLAVNARDAMPKGGRLTIETDSVTLDDAEAHLPPGAYVMLAVSDTGVGMSAATQAQIFEPLFTTKGPGQGTGLGLTTVHDIVKQNGGAIVVESALGQGATFKVYLPQVDDDLPGCKSNALLRSIPRGDETVLLVEDEEAVRSLTRRVLETCGYTVLEASDGDEAVRLGERHEADIHLLLADVVLPTLSGRALIDRLTALKPKLRVLFLSGYTDDAVTRHGVRGDEFAFLQKPFTPSALAQKVREELDRVIV